MIILPNRQTKRVTQPNRGNILGDFWSSFNINLQDNPGAIRVGNRLKLLTSTADQANLGVPIGFKVFDTKIFTIAGSRVFSSSSLLSAFTEDASSGAVTTYSEDLSDLENFNNTLVTVVGAKLYSKALDGTGAGAWTERASLANTTAAHKLCFFKKFDRIYVADSTTTGAISSLDTGWVHATSGDYYIETGIFGLMPCLVATTDSLWAGIVRTTGASHAFTRGTSVFQWDGISSQITKEHIIPASGVVAMLAEGDIPYALDTNGILRAYNGNKFEEIGRLPLKRNQYLSFPNDATNDRFVHPNGMVMTENGTILVLVCNRNNYLVGSTENVNENLPSGIWEWSKENGFVHKNSLSYMPLTSTTVTDYGQNRIKRAGGLAIAKISSTTAQNSIICGAEYYTDATTSTKGIFVDAPYPTNNATYPEGQKYGYFVTDWIQSQNLNDVWQKAALKYRKFLDSTDKIWLKYRITEADPTEISITWGTVTPTTSTFTTTTDLSTYVGYEVEIIQGTGSGKCGHIVSVTGSGTYTVTLDESFVGGVGTAKARIQAWKKIIVPNERTLEEVIAGISETVASSRIQIKCCMQFTGDDEIRELILINNVHTKLS